MRPDFDVLPVFLNLQAIFTRGAGPESFSDHPNLPKAPMTKLEAVDGDPMMTEYAVMHVLRLHRRMNQRIKK
jgi:glyoxylate/hydroxypyruvate reductase A